MVNVKIKTGAIHPYINIFHRHNGKILIKDLRLINRCKDKYYKNKVKDIRIVN